MSDEGFTISASFIIPRSDINDIYRKCTEWLTQVKASITEQKKPYFIHAFQQDWRKRRSPYRVIEMTLKQDRDFVVVDFFIPKSLGEHDYWFTRGGHDSWSNLESLLKEFCEFMGVDATRI
jgi:hypothetical protein